MILGGFVMVFSKAGKQNLKDEVKENQADLSTEAPDLDKIPATTQNSQEKSVFQITTEEVNKIVIYNGIEKIELLPSSPYSVEEVRTNLSGWFMHGPYKNVYSVKFNKMSDMLYGLETIKPEKIIDENEGNLDEYGLTNVDFKITIGSGDKEETILIGAPANNESHYAKLETDDKIYTINNTALEPYSVSPQSNNAYPNAAPSWYDQRIKFRRCFFMSQEKLIIVPVTLHPDSEDVLPLATPNTSGICVIKTVTAEISFYNGLEERIIQTVMRELKHL